MSGDVDVDALGDGPPENHSRITWNAMLATKTEAGRTSQTLNTMVTEVLRKD